MSLYYNGSQGCGSGILPYLDMEESFVVFTPIFFRFLIQLGFYCMPQLKLIHPFFLQKKSGCLYHN